jgi:germination protein M
VTSRGIVAIAGAVGLVGLLAWGLTAGLERVMRPAAPAADTAAAPPEPAATPVRHITATLFVGAADGQHLTPVQREVPFGEGTVEQGRQLVIAQLEAGADAPLIRVVPAGATLRAFYVTEGGEAFVDLGPEIVAAHPGGTTAEQLTVYAIVNAIITNLPSVASVQLLVDGREVDSLAGHVDLRRPLTRNDAVLVK